MTQNKDPFEERRRTDGVLACPYNGERVRMLLRHEDVRKAARDWQTFSSDAPFRVPVPSEEHLRSVRQLPIETNPPDHTEYRRIVEPFFKRSKQPGVQTQVSSIIDGLIVHAVKQPRIEVVTKLATPVQSRALACMLNLPQSDADEWIEWGSNALLDTEGNSTGDRLETYLRRQIERARQHPGDDFFSALTRARFRDRPLTEEEILGFANLTFAGGRDTVIHTISTVMGYLAEHEELFERLRRSPDLIVGAAEDFFRYTSPLTHIGRVCPNGAEVHGEEVPPDERVSLGWAAANWDPTVFDSPQEVRPDRRPNPHVAFGFGPHLCLGAPQARLIVRTLLTTLCERVGSLRIVEQVERVEREAEYERSVGYESLVMKLGSREAGALATPVE